MPIHPLGFQASIQTEDGQDLEEFKVETEDNKCTCYVPCETGKRFQIRFTDKRPPDPSNHQLDFSVNFAVDGQNMSSKSCPAPTSRQPLPVVISKGRSTSPTSYKPYQFGEVKRSEEDTECCLDEKVLKELGSISIQIYRGKRGKASKAHSQKKNIQLNQFHEKSKKAAKISNQVHLSGVEKRHFTHRRDFTRKDKTPYATFIFYYRSRAILELEEIIPHRSPSPLPGSPAVEPPPTPPKPKVEKLRKVSSTPGLLSGEKKPNVVGSSSRSGRKRQVIDLDEDDLEESFGARKRKKYELGGDGVEFMSARKKDSKPFKMEKGEGGRDVILLD